MTKKNHAPIIVFFAFACLVILYHLFGYFGHFGYDDMLYARIAKNWVDGQLNLDNAFSYRFTIIALTALSYRIFGVNDPASALPAITISLSILFLIYSILKNQGTLQTILGLTLTLSINALLFFTDKIMPDIYVALFLLLALYLYNRFRFTSAKSVVLHASLFSLSMFLAFNSKETAILFLPLVVAILIIDLLNKRMTRFWSFSAISGLLIIAGYLTIIKLLTGSFFTRFDILIENHRLQSFMYSYDKLPVTHLLNRIGYEQLFSYLREGVLVPFIFIATALFSSEFKKIVKFNDTFSLFVFSSVTLLLSINFMSVSPFSYNPVPTEPRHSLFIIPVAAIAASFILKEYLTGKKFLYTLPLSFLIISVVAFFTDRTTAFKLYIPLAVLFIVFSLIRNRTKFTPLFVALFVIIMFIKPLFFFHYSFANVKYRMQKRIVYEYFIKPDEPCYVFTDPVQKNFGDYYTGFDDTGHCQFVDYTKINRDTFDENRAKYLFLNWHTQYSSKSWDKLPYFAANVDSTYTLLYENRKQNIFLYRMENLILPEIHGVKLLNTKNDFQIDYCYWTPVTHYLTKNGKRIHKPGEYSALFSVPVDSLIKDGIIGNLYITCRLRAFFKAPPSLILVVSIENEDENLFWYGKNLEEEVFKIKEWVNVNHEITIKQEEIYNEGSLKIYLWNPRSDTAYIDDFEINIYKMN